MKKLLYLLTLLCAACQGVDCSPDVADVGEVAQATQGCERISGVRQLTLGPPTDVSYWCDPRYQSHCDLGAPQYGSSASSDPRTIDLRVGASSPQRSDGRLTCILIGAIEGLNLGITENGVWQDPGSCLAQLHYACGFGPANGGIWREYWLRAYGDYHTPNWLGAIPAKVSVFESYTLTTSDPWSGYQEHGAPAYTDLQSEFDVIGTLSAASTTPGR